jgi:hypothetical protein
MSGKVQWLLFILLALTAVLFRLFAYNHLTDSLGTQDTGSYIAASKIPFPSLQFFTSNRSASLPLLYKLLRPSSDYQLDLVSNPNITGGDRFPGNQPGFEPVIAVQIGFSLVGWLVLAVVVFRHLKNPVVKFLTVGLILAFGFSPQMADWDYMLMSESLSFSLFVLIFAFGIELVFGFQSSARMPAWKTYLWLFLFYLVMIVWLFSRDTNSYLVLFSGAMVLLVSLTLIWRKKLPLIPLIVFGCLLFGLFYFQQVTFRISERWLLPLLNNMTANVFPYPERVRYFASNGMPVSKDLTRLRGYAEFNGIYNQTDFIDWAKKNGLTTYTKFLVRNPRWVLRSIYIDLEAVFSLNRQWYFEDSYPGHPAILIPIGDILHAQSSVVLLIDFLLLLLLIGLARQSTTPRSKAWVIFAAWAFLGSVILLMAGYFGEARSIARHTLSGTIPLRLLLWLLAGIAADLIFSSAVGIQAKATQPGDQ